MATLFSDDFNRADSSTIGGNWVESGSGDWEIISNQVRDAISGGGASSQLTNTTSLGSADYAVEAVITQGSLVSVGGSGMGLMARRTDVDNYYLAWINEGGTDYILYSVSGGFTEIGTRWTTTALADPVTLRLECQGSTIRVFVNGTERISVTDSTHTAEGDFGFRVFNGANFTNHRFDSFIVTDFGGPPQFARPTSDSSVGTWTTDTGGTTNLYQAIDESSASDADYIQSVADP